MSESSKSPPASPSQVRQEEVTCKGLYRLSGTCLENREASMLKKSRATLSLVLGVALCAGGGPSSPFRRRCIQR